MEIVIHAHHAVISDHMRQRAERFARKLAALCPRAVDALIRFETDGPSRRVEIVLHESGRKAVVGAGAGRTYGPALTEASQRVATQLRRAKRATRPSGRARRRAAPTGA